MNLNRIKRLISIVGISFGLVLIFGLSYYYFAPSNEIRIQGDHKVYNTPDELVNDSDFVVVAKILSDFGDYESELTYTPDGRIDNYSTAYDVQITKVIKGSLKTGDLIKVAQRAAYIPVSYKKNKDLMLHEDVSLFKKGKKYLLMLSKAENDYYRIISINQGKFNVDNSDADEDNKGTSTAQYKQLKDKVKLKHKDEFK